MSTTPRPATRTVERVVEVICQGHGFGSGYLVGGRAILTAAHNVPDGPLEARFLSGRTHPVLRALVDDDLDLALVVITDDDFPAAPYLPCADVDRMSDLPVEGCFAVGFPRFKERRGTPGTARLHDNAQLDGVILPRSGMVSGRLEFQVTASPLPADMALSESEWSGISGAVICARRPHRSNVVVGVITEHHQPEGQSALAAVPISAVLDDEGWRGHLGLTSGAGLARLPHRPSYEPSPYLATVTELRRRTPVLIDRLPALTMLAGFSQSADGYLWLKGARWSGKTALLSHFALSPPEDVDVVAYFLVPTGDATSQRFALVANDQLARLLDDDPSMGTDLDAFRARWERAVDQAEREQRHLLLVVDGLEGDTSARRDLASLAATLPRHTGSRAHVLVSSADDTALPGDVDVGHPLYDAHTESLAEPSERVRLHNRAVEERHRLCPVCKRNDEVETLPVAVGKLGGGSDGQPAAPGTIASRLELPHSDQSYMLSWAIRASVLALLFFMGGCAATAAESNSFDDSDSSGAAAPLFLLGLVIAGIPWGIIVNRSNIRNRCRRAWATLHFCHRDQLVFQATTGIWVYPGAFTRYIKAMAAIGTPAPPRPPPTGTAYPF